MHRVIRTSRTSRTSIALLGLALLGGGCRRAPADPAWSAASSAAYRAAWEKSRAGDDKAAEAMFAAVAKEHRGTRASVRAGDDRPFDLSAMTSLSSLMQALSRSLQPRLGEPDPDDAPIPDEPDEPALPPEEPSPGGP